MDYKTQIGLLLIFAVLIVAFVLTAGRRSISTYPDGRCYLCRRGRCQPGETCPECGTDQPPLTRPMYEEVEGLSDPVIVDANQTLGQVTEQIEALVAKGQRVGVRIGDRLIWFGGES